MFSYRIVPAHDVPEANRRAHDPVKKPRKSTGPHPNQVRRFPCFSFDGKGPTYRPTYLAKQADQDAAQQAVVIMSTDALIRAQGIKVPIPTRGVLAAYLATPDERLQAEADRQYGRTLIDPSYFSDRYLKLYLERLAPFATAHSSTSLIDPPSPRLAAYLLNGMTLMALEELCHRAMEVLEVTTPEVDATLSDAMACVGFGEGANHTHFDSLKASDFNWQLHEDHDIYLRRRDKLEAEGAVKTTENLSIRQNFLIKDLPRNGSFAMGLLSGQGAYQAAEQQMIARIKPIILKEVADLFNGPTDMGMSEFKYKELLGTNVSAYRAAIAFDNELFSRSVRRVYEKPWIELDFHADFSNLSTDVEVMIARRLIARMSSGKRGVKKVICISAVVLLGLALLTGIPVGKWVAFALMDLSRRGETFITPETLDEVIEMLEMSEVGVRAQACIAELREYQVALRSTENEFKSRFAWKLRRGTRPFWSAMTYGPDSYYLTGYNTKDEPTYKFNFDPYLSRD